MKKTICALVLLLTGISAFSQIGNLNKRVSELKSLGVDTLVTFQSSCAMCSNRYDSFKIGTCLSLNEKYLLWIKGGQNFIQLFDDCFTYNPLSVNPEFFNLIKKHIAEIAAEKIKPVQFKAIYQGKESMIVTQETDGPEWNFEIYLQSTVSKKKFQQL